MKRNKYLLIFVVVLVTVIVLGTFYSAAGKQKMNSSAKTKSNRVIYPTPTGGRPGENDPMGNPNCRTILEDAVLQISIGYDTPVMATNIDIPFDDNLKGWYATSDSTSWSVPMYNMQSPVEVAKGRPLNLKEEDPIVAYYTKEDDGTVKPVIAFQRNLGYYGKIPGTYQSGDPWGIFSSIDIEIGDIDGETDSNGEVKEEVVVAYRKYNGDNKYSVWLTALNAKGYYSDCFEVIDTVKTNDDMPWYGDGSFWSVCFMSLTTGDFDGDSIDEIALFYKTYVGDNWYLYTFDCQDGKLTQRGVLSEDFQIAYNSVDLASGDFDGDGKDEIAALFGRNTSWEHSDNLKFPVYINIYKMDDNLTPVKKASYCGKEDAEYCNKGAAITSGFFKLDNKNGYTVNRRQLAVVTAYEIDDRQWLPFVSSYDVDDNLQPVYKSSIPAYPGSYPIGQEVAHLKPSITSGRFLSFENERLNDQVVATWGHTPYTGSESTMIYNAFFLDENNMSLSKPGEPPSYYVYPQDWHYSMNPLNRAPFAGIATAPEGKSYHLGAPAHIYLPRVMRTNRVIQEPPKHIDYLPDENGDWKVINASRSRDFYATFQDEEDSSITTTSTDKSNWDIGGSVAVTAKETIKAAVIKTTVKESAKISKNYESTTTDINGEYVEIETKSDFDTKRDDYVQMFVQTLDIWRYPVYGLKTDDGNNAFYELVIPGPSYKVNAAGCDLSDYYQPVHENGNLLSYPQTLDNPLPDDMGTFNVAGEPLASPTPMSGDTVLAYSSMSGSQGISWAKESWNSEEKSTCNTLSENADVKLSVKAKIKIVKIKASVDVSFHNSKSFSDTSYSENKLSSNKGITINLPSDTGTDYAYTFKPLVYSTKDGTLKLAHTVNPEGSSQGDWWQTHYHNQPDISLNLPKKFHFTPNPDDSEHKGTWELAKTRQSRSRMRGLYLLTKEPDLEDDSNNSYLAGAPTAGDKIWVMTRVYNYSLNTSTGPFKVLFSYAKYDPDLGDNEPDLTTIGSATVDNLDALKNKQVYVQWDTTGLGGSNSAEPQSYVIYVTVDPDNEVKNEFHELYAGDQTPAPSGQDVKQVFTGSNNQGFWPWDNSFVVFSKSEDVEDEDDAAEISIKQESLELQNTAESAEYPDACYTELPYRLKLKLVSDKSDKEFRDVFFYDNNKMFAMKRSFGLKQGENDFYCQWTPTEAGEHIIQAAILEDENDSKKGNNMVMLNVTVTKFGSTPTSDTDTGSSEKSGFCFIATAAYGSQQEHHVKVLRQFRDKYLLTNNPGRAFVKQYYRLSPPIARDIADSKTKKAVVRIALIPLYIFAYGMVNLGFWKMAMILLLTVVFSGFLFRYGKRKLISKN